MPTKQKTPSEISQVPDNVPEIQLGDNEKLKNPKAEAGFNIIIKNPGNNSNEIWSIMGFITAGVPLLGAAVLYLVGWTYISNWYGFFGINIYQIDVPIHHILVNSVSLILISLMAFLFAVTIDHIILNIDNARKNQNSEKGNNQSQKTRNRNIQSINLRRVMVIYIIPIIIILGYYIYNCYCITSSFDYRNFPEELIWFVAVFWSTIVFYIKNLEKSKNAKHAGMINGSMIAISILISWVSLSAVAGIADAAEGRQRAWRIPQVQISSNSLLFVLDEYRRPSDPESGLFEYGPFGLVAENNRTIYLVPWLDKNEDYFSPSPELFILQRSEHMTLDIHVP